MADNPILSDEQQDKEYSPPPPPLPTTPVSERPTQPLVRIRSRPFGTRSKNVPDCVYRALFESFMIVLCMYFKIIYK